jgi:hypothetical protein
MNKTSGQIFNVWTKEELNEIVSVMQDLPIINILGNDCRGIDENHIEYYWFMSVVFEKISRLFDEEILPVFGMYLHETNPWKIHTDAYHCEKFEDREPAYSILIPYSLDNDVKNLDKGFTLVFNERLDSNNDIKNLPEVQNNSLNLFEEHLSHNNKEVLKRVSLQEIYSWTFGSVIFWDSLLLHDSNNFLRYGLKSKQAIVIHTYRKK